MKTTISRKLWSMLLLVLLIGPETDVITPPSLPDVLQDVLVVHFGINKVIPSKIVD